MWLVYSCHRWISCKDVGGRSVQVLHSYYSVRTLSCENSQLMRLFWLHPSSLLSALCSLRAGTRHCSSVAHILPPPPSVFLFFCFPCSSFAYTGVKRNSVGVDGEIWLLIGLLNIISVRLSVQRVWSPYVMHDLNISKTAPKYKVKTFLKVGFGWNLNIYIYICIHTYACLWVKCDLI